jgi:hypothetical protein
MKILRLIFVVAAIVVVASALNRRARAQSGDSGGDRGMQGQYEQLVLSLSKRGDTNTAEQVSRLVSAMSTSRDATDMVFDIHLLTWIRSGRTNEAIQFLEGALDGSIASFGVPSGKAHDPKYDKILKMAREYRDKHPHEASTPEMDSAIKQAFDSIPK